MAMALAMTMVAMAMVMAYLGAGAETLYIHHIGWALSPTPRPRPRLQKLSTIHPWCRWAIRLRGGSICPSTAYLGVETLYTYIIWIWDLGFGKHSIMAQPHQTGRGALPPRLQKKSTLTSGGVPGLRMGLHTHTAYLGVETPYIHIWYGFVKHSKWGLRLSLGSTTSDRVGPSLKLPKTHPWYMWGIRLRVVPYTNPQLIKVLKHLIYVLYGFVKHSKWGLRLNHDVSTSDRSITTSYLQIPENRP